VVPDDENNTPYSNLAERYIRISIRYRNGMVYPANDPPATKYRTIRLGDGHRSPCVRNIGVILVAEKRRESTEAK
jgi:hypothetical protein